MFNKEKFLTRLLVGIAVLLFLIGLNTEMNIYDEGIGLVGAERIGMGEKPYTDFWTLYPPLNYYLIAGFSMLFGGSITSPRFLAMIIAVFSLIVLHKMIKKTNDYEPMFVQGLGLVLLLSVNLFFARPMGLVILFSALALLFTINQFYEDSYLQPLNIDSPDSDDDDSWIKKEKPLTKYLVLSGIMIGLTTLTRLDIGVYLYFSIALSVFVIYDYTFRKKIKAFAFITLSALIVCLIMFVYLLSFVTVGELYDQLVYFPVFVFHDYRALPWPQITDFLFADETNNVKLKLFWLGLYALIPLALFIISLFRVITAHKEKDLNPRTLSAFPIILFAALLLLQALVRSDIEHFLPSWIFALTGLFVIFDIKKLELPQKLLVLFILLGFFGFIGAVKFVKIDKITKGDFSQIEQISRAEKHKVPNDYKIMLEDAVVYIQKYTNNNERIFVCNDRHDLGYRNDVLFYFLAERLPGTKYHELHPGLTTKAEYQKKIIKDLQSNDVMYIVRVYELNDIIEPNLSSVSSGVYILDEYIAENYEKVQRFGIYEILKRI